MSVASVVALLGAFVLGAREARQWMVSTDRFRAREITVTGLGRTRETEVLHVAHLSSERNVLSIDCERAARQIESLPWVAHAHVTRHLPGTVAVSVEERTAVATVSADHVYLVSSDGTLFKRAAPGDPADLPVITGIPRADFERDPTGAREGVRDVLALLSDVEASAVGAPLRVDEVHRELTGDLSIVLEGTHVWLGRGPYRAKLTRLRVVIRELHRRGLRGSEIHLESDRHPERVTVRLADRAAP
jgi:cell division protein FtsQ